MLQKPQCILPAATKAAQTKGSMHILQHYLPNQKQPKAFG